MKLLRKQDHPGTNLRDEKLRFYDTYGNTEVFANKSDLKYA